MYKDITLDEAIRRIKDFPKPGIKFYDVTSVFVDKIAYPYVIKQMIKLYKKERFDGVAAIESRGFLFAAPFCYKLNIPLLLIRKKGKLPGPVYRCEYELEYGSAEIEAHKSDILDGGRYLIIDDLLATGGTVEAAINILKQGNAYVSDVFALIGLPDLKYKEKLKDVKVRTLLEYYDNGECKELV